MSSTPRSADHDGFDALAVGWALHALEPDDEVAFARHLPDCDRCARTVADTEEVMAALATDLPRAEPSPELRSRLRAAVGRTEQVRRPPASVPAAEGDGVPPRRRTDADRPPPELPGAVQEGAASRPAFAALRERGWALALAAAVAGIVGLGIWNVSLDAARDRALAAAAQQSAIVQELLQPGSRVVARLDAGDDRVAAVVDRDGDLQVLSEGLEVNDESRKTYVLWGIRGSDAPEAVGTFDVLRSRLDLNAVGSTGTGSGAYDQYAISLEPGRQPPAAPSQVLAIGQVTS